MGLGYTSLYACLRRPFIVAPKNLKAPWSLFTTPAVFAQAWGRRHIDLRKAMLLYPAIGEWENGSLQPIC